jgi:putative superfamily III holin-X
MPETPPPQTPPTSPPGATPPPGGTPPIPPPEPPPPIPPPGQPEEERTLADLVVEVSERGSTLVREEIELAKAEVSEKVGKLVRGSVVGIAAGAFAFLALILVMEGIAWLLNEEVFDGKTWPGFFIEAAAFLLIAALAGLLAYKAVKAGSPPVPQQAIDEAKLTKETIASELSKEAE